MDVLGAVNDSTMHKVKTDHLFVHKDPFHPLDRKLDGCHDESNAYAVVLQGDCSDDQQKNFGLPGTED